MTLSPNLSDNATATLYGLTHGLRARVTQATMQEELQRHPDFPSLLSLSDLLTDWHIDNTALQLNTGEQLRELPLPFIAHQKKQGGWYVLVTNLTGDRITYTDSERGRVIEPLAEFEKQWTGVVLLAEADDQSGEPDYARNRPAEIRENLRGPLVLAGTMLIAFLVMLSVAQHLTAPDWLLLLTKSAGLLLSGLLVAKQLGSKNALTNRLCRLNEHTNCDDVLNSPAAKLWGWLSWTDVGLLYFAGGLLTVLLVGIQPAMHPLLYALALLALPYTVFSVYYQARVLRQWCPLCLGVQAVLVAEAIIAVTQLSPLPAVAPPYLAMLTAFLLPVLAWVLLKPLVADQSKRRREYGELLALKRNPSLFGAMLTQQPKMPLIPDDLHPIILGNPEAEHTITMVTNPFCGPCATMHSQLEHVLSRNANINVAIIFTGNSEKGQQVAAHAIALAGQNAAGVALTDWYGQSAKHYDEWAKRYPVDLVEPACSEIAERHRQWCDLAGITETPTLYVDGYKLPGMYTVSELSRMLQRTPVSTQNLLTV